MAQYRFYYNLRPETYQTRLDGMADPQGYLLSIHRYSPVFIDFARTLKREHGEVVLADNGFFARIQQIQKKFQAEADQFRGDLIAARAENQASDPPKPLSPDLRLRARELARRIRDTVYECEDRKSFPSVISEQQRIAPDLFIVMEDMFMASLVSLNLEPELLGARRSYYASHNNRSARFFRQLVQKKFGPYEGTPYAVASAVDYNSAFDAGAIMAREGIPHFAIGTGAYMADDDYADSYRIGRTTVGIGRLVPRRYLRTALVSRGLVDGYRAVGGADPEGIHFLGLGAPIMIMIACLVAQRVSVVSFDATSPIKDAVEGTLYVTDPTYLKLRARNLALWYATNPQDTWSCTCAYCQRFLPRYPFDYEAGARWGEQHPSVKTLDAADLAEDSPLAKAFPLFGEPRSGELRADISTWRIGHNHLMLERQMDETNHSSDAEGLRRLGDLRITTYTDRATPTYAAAVSLAYRFATESMPLQHSPLAKRAAHSGSSGGSHSSPSSGSPGSSSSSSSSSGTSSSTIIGSSSRPGRAPKYTAHS
ncbi:MAG: hypothetical protein ABL971_00545 [Vicinamibacterales bacterium]